MTVETRAKQVFLDALDVDAGERDAFVARACGADAELRERVLALLASHERAPDVLDASASTPQLGRWVERALDELDVGPGDVLRDYRLERVLGEGGFGRVFLAHQLRPVERPVAVKVLKLGLDTRAVLARFEAERQALARMRHPNIACVLDAGTTDSGRPFFVMELVDGAPITEFCRVRRAGLRERLELFASVCLALQHAHSKGVVHRDVKPGNVLVVMVDGVALPRVIDFGIAKALAEDALVPAAVTIQGHVLGTPAYMSPEQAAASADVDTRSDVYSLGALCYELLTGRPPFEHGGARDDDLAELLRRIREEEPDPPSTVARRGVVAAGVPQTFPRELDWIVLRCLEKDRERRYATAYDLAADVRRFLASEPIDAAPPSGLYRLRKLVARHRVAFASSAAIVLAIALGLAGAWNGLRRAEAANLELDGALASASAQALEAAKQAELALAVNGFLVEDLLRAARPSTAIGEGRDVRLLDVVAQASERLDRACEPGGRFDGAPHIEVRVRLALGQTLSALGLDRDAVPELRRALDTAVREPSVDPFDRLRAAAALAKALNGSGEYAETERLLAEWLPELRRAPRELRAERYAAEIELGTCLWRQGRLDEAAESQRTALAQAEAELGADDGQVLALTSGLGIVEALNRRPEVAEPLMRKVVERRTELLGPDDPLTLSSRTNLATFFSTQGRLEEARAELAAVLESARLAYGPEHPSTLVAQASLGATLAELGRLDEAELLIAGALETREKVRGRAHDDTLTSLGELARLNDTAGRLERAEELFGEACARASEAHGVDSVGALDPCENLCVFYYRHGRFAEALPIAERVFASSRTAFGAADRRTLLRLDRAATLAREAGELARAEELLLAGLELAIALGPADPLYTDLHVELTRVWGARGEWAKVLELSQKLFAEVAGPAPAQGRIAAELAAGACDGLGQGESALEWRAKADAAR